MASLLAISSVKVLTVSVFYFLSVAKRNDRHFPLQRGPSGDATRCTPTCTSPRLHVWGKTAGERLASLFSFQCSHYLVLEMVVFFCFYYMIYFVFQQGNGNSCRQSATQRRESLVSLMLRRKTCHLSMYARSSGTMETWQIENSVMTRGSTLGKHKSLCLINCRW